jgi:Ran-binding protein 9/10
MGLCSSQKRLEEQQLVPPQLHGGHPPSQDTTLPAWEPAPERSHTLGLFNDASDDDWESAEMFCRTHPHTPPRMLASTVIDRIRLLGCAAWSLEQPATPRFVGRIDRGNQEESGTAVGTWKVCTQKRCKDTCLLSDLPLMAGLYDIHDKLGVYYEVRVNKMEGVVAIGMFSEFPPPHRGFMSAMS